MPTSHNCFLIVRILFIPIRSISWVVSSSFLRRSSCLNSSFATCSYHSPNLTGASFKYPLINDLFVLMYLNPLKYLHSFSNSSRWIVPLLLSFSILTAVCSRFLFLFSHINLFVVSIPPVVPSIPSQVYAISLLIFSTRISSMLNPLLVINLSWWRIHIT